MSKVSLDCVFGCVFEICPRKMLAFWFVILPLISQTTTATDVISGCPDTCGTVHVPYPFGINFTSGISNPNCALNSFFMFTCNVTYDPPRLFFGRNMPIHNISVEEGTISVRIDSAFKCYNKAGLTLKFDQNIRLGKRPVSVLGYSKQAHSYRWVRYFSPSLRDLLQRTFSDKGLSMVFKAGQLSCSSTFASQQKQFVSSLLFLEWVVREEIVKADKSSSIQINSNKYACGSNSNCTYSENGKGYRCICKDGFTGNPYLPQGCQDIDECKEPDKYKCDGSCKNTIGSYKCSCPFGMRGDGKVGCQGFRITTIAAVVGGVASIMVIAFLIIILYKRRRNERNFLKNGGLLLKHQRVRILRIFTEAELVKATKTKNYDQSLLLGEGGFGYVYKGVLADNTQVAVKKPKDKDKTQINQEFQQELGIVSQVNHRNVVKVLGLCLETNVPLLVYEFISHGTLSQHIHYNRSKILATWKNRLRVAAETALALDYLHSLADPPIIHGDVQASNILLDGYLHCKSI
ncbi:wall-associated receptor kinase 2-like [Jatropha curcas]|uniref:wall-associated receptor kinase 2-like n=1 Tax=Jatropha curcas TaxID=180498 RepID=UPI001895C981|nr:wall-associated receptor kinase 2-like [Jatropha curcas]